MLPVGSLFCQNPDRLSSTPINDVYDSIDVNNCKMLMGNDGILSHNPQLGFSGFEWMKETKKFLVGREGMLWSGLVSGVATAGGSSRVTGLQAGKILPGGVPSDPNDPSARIYKIRRLSRSDFFQLPLAEQSRERNDFVQWPVLDGAPFIDRDANGSYNPDFTKWLDDQSSSDAPFFPGDEVLWCVGNDMDPSRTASLYGAQPLGFEVHTLVWASTSPACLSNVVFSRHTIINKGNEDLVEAYFGIYVDISLGDGGDDFVGIDTSLGMAYGYNGHGTDPIYGIPPAIGYLLLQAPIEKANPTQSAVYNFATRHGYRNIPVSSFVFFGEENGLYREPVLGSATGSFEMHQCMRGKKPDGSSYIDPVSGKPTNICLAGDPVQNTGWNDGTLEAPGERRFVLACGPVTFARGDTQEIVIARIAALGSDRLGSVDKLRNIAPCVRNEFLSTHITSAPALPPEDARMQLEIFPSPCRWADVSVGKTPGILVSNPKEMPVSLSLSDVLGHQKRFYHAVITPGVHRIEIPRNLLDHPGIYFLTGVTQDGLVMKKLVIY